MDRLRLADRGAARQNVIVERAADPALSGLNRSRRRSGRLPMADADLVGIQSREVTKWMTSDIWVTFIVVLMS
jgi:hypothetical protein